MEEKKTNKGASLAQIARHEATRKLVEKHKLEYEALYNSIYSAEKKKNEEPPQKPHCEPDF